MTWLLLGRFIVLAALLALTGSIAWAALTGRG
jgi:hypothetical protein